MRIFNSATVVRYFVKLSQSDSKHYRGYFEIRCDKCKHVRVVRQDRVQSLCPRCDNVREIR